MGNKLEELLNSLIEKGRTKKAHHLQGLPNKPFVRCFKDMTHGIQFYYYEWWDNEAKLVKIYSLRDIVSKESGLWQFVCENGMIKHEVYEDIQSWEHTTAEHSDFWYTSGDNYEFYVIESALKDDGELEDFLLKNIKVDEKD